MKTLEKQIKNTVLLISLIFFVNSYSQNKVISHGMYVRAYNLEGIKIGKGKLFAFSDTLLILKQNSKLINLDPMKIGKIKTKHSTGHNILIGSLVGGATGAIVGAASSNQQTKTRDGGWLFGEYEYTTGTSSGTGAAIGGTIGILGGAITGLSISAFKNSNTFVINGDEANWKAFRANFKNSEVNNDIN